MPTKHKSAKPRAGSSTQGASLALASGRAKSASGGAPRKASVPAAQEVRELRAEAQRLGDELAMLCAKWRAALPERQVLLAACAAAKQKAVTGRVEQLNVRLKDELLQQQLYYSALQQQLTQAPLWSRSALCQQLFDRLHGQLRLVAGSPDARRQQLTSRFELSLRLAPGLVDAFTADFVPLTSHVLPFSRTSTSATSISPPLEASSSSEGSATCGTFVSNVFVCKIPASANIPYIFENLMENLRLAPRELERRLGVLVEPMHEQPLGPRRNYTRVRRQDGEMRGARTNRTICGQLNSDDLAMIVTDFVDEDAEEAQDDAVQERLDAAATRKAEEGGGDVPVVLPAPCHTRIDICSVLTLARVKDPQTLAPVVLLRRLRVHRYSLPPNSPVLHRELNRLLPYYNGDFHMAMLSDAFQGKMGDVEAEAAAAATVAGPQDASHSFYDRKRGVSEQERAVEDVVKQEVEPLEPGQSAKKRKTERTAEHKNDETAAVRPEASKLPSVATAASSG